MTEAPPHVESSTLRHYLSILNRRRWLVVLALVLVPAAALALSSTREPLYEAEAGVLLSRQNLAAALTGTTDPSIYLDDTRFAETQAELASVPEVAGRTLRAVGLGDRSPGDLLRASTVIAQPNVDLLEFRVRDRDAALAARLATEYARQFTLFRAELDTAGLTRARQEVTRRIQELRETGPASSPLLESLLDKEQQLLTMETLQTTNAYVVREAGEAERISPRPVRDAVLAIMFGLGLGLVLALVAESLDTRIRSVDELVERLQLPLLGTVPTPPRGLRRAGSVAVLDEPDEPSTEAYRMLRTNIDFANLDRGARTIMLTSALEAEGKSTTIANLGVAYARAGHSVVLVDLDLRRPMLHQLFSLDPRPGLTEVALRYVELDKALTRIPIRREGTSRPDGGEGSLVVLRSGAVPPDASEFVASRALDAILEALRERATIVLVDAPPLLQVGDAMALTSKVDALVLVTRLKVIRRTMTRHLNRLLSASPVAKLGFVVTGTPAAPGYGYGYAAEKPRLRRGATGWPFGPLRRRRPLRRVRVPLESDGGQAPARARTARSARRR